jgi:hypothetical protein
MTTWPPRSRSRPLYGFRDVAINRTRQQKMRTQPAPSDGIAPSGANGDDGGRMRIAGAPPPAVVVPAGDDRQPLTAPEVLVRARLAGDLAEVFRASRTREAAPPSTIGQTATVMTASVPARRPAEE